MRFGQLRVVVIQNLLTLADKPKNSSQRTSVRSGPQAQRVFIVEPCVSSCAIRSYHLDVKFRRGFNRLPRAFVNVVSQGQGHDGVVVAAGFGFH